MTGTGLGFAGVGGLGQALVRQVSGCASLHVAGIQDARPEVAAEVAERSGSPWHGVAYADLLGQPGVDAVVICSPNSLHVPQAQAALRAGKHVLVQKPLALSEADARASIELAQAMGRVLFVDYTYRFLETMQRFRRRLTQAGQVHAARAVFHNIYGPGSEKTWFFDPRMSGGGALTDLGVHLLDLGLWLLQPQAVETESVQMTHAGQPVEHAADLRIQLDHRPFELSVSWNAELAETEIAFEVDTDRGLLRWENVAGSFYRFRTRTADEVLLDRETALRDDTLRAFEHALAADSAPPIDLRVYKLLDAAYGR